MRFREGKLVLVKLSEQRNAKEFIYQVLSNKEGNITVKFLKKIPAFDRYEWPDADETGTLNASKVLHPNEV